MAMVNISARERYHRYYDLLEGGVCLILADGSEQVVFASAQTARLYECESEEEFLDFCSSSYRNMMEAEDYVPIASSVNGHTNHFHLTFHYRTKGGHFRKVEGFGWLKETSFGAAYVVQIFSAEQIAEDRKRDGTTDLPGMHDFYKEAFKRVAKRKADGTLSAFCPVIFDITRFREYNRIHGTHRGDLCLKKAAETITDSFPGSLVGHLTADRFVALLPADSLEAKLEQVCNEINRYIDDAGIQMKAGVYRIEPDAAEEEIRHSFDSAKVACDSIKQDGNRVVAVYEPSMGEYLNKKMYVLRHFSEALEKCYIKVYFQPVIRTMTGRLCGFEALARWEDPEIGMISPAIFVPVLEEAQLINRLDRFVLERVLKLLRNRMDNGLPLIPVSINLSGYDFEVADPFHSIQTMVRRYQVPRSALRFEITERVMIRNRLSMVSTIRRFQEAGYQVWMDDFGSEYSSLTSLHYYHFDEIKIDMGFFSHFDDRSRQIITSVVMMAKRLGVLTLAEGVETAEQVSFLRKIGCGRIQGYYYGRPMFLEDCLDYMHEKKMGLEDPEEGQLLDAAESVNVVTDSPTALFHFDGKDITLLIENDAYRRELRSTGTQDMEEANLNLHAMDYPFRGKFTQLLSKALKSRTEETMVYVDNGQFIRVSVRWIAGGERNWVGEAKIYNVSSQSGIRDAGEMDVLLRNLYQLYDGLYLMDRGKDEIRVLQCDHPKVRPGTIFRSIMPSFASYADELVHPDDRERFLAFVRPENIEERGGRVTELVRVRREDGTYRWTVFDAMVIFKSLTKNILLCEREDIWERKHSRDTLLPVFCRSFGVGTCAAGVQAEPAESSLFRALRDRSPYPFFWKDRDGRILGASLAFLRKTGFDDEAALRGRTEKELGWRLDSSELDEAEEMVLRHDERLAETKGQALAGGRLESVRIAWTPWYREKEMTGTLAMISAVGTSGREERRQGMSDTETGFLSYRGAIEVGLAFADQYRLKDVDYVGYLIDIAAYAEVAKEDARKAGALLKEITRILRQAFPSGWAIARVGLCCFLLFGRKENASDLGRKEESLSGLMPSLRKRLGLRPDLVLTDAAAYGSEVKSLDEMLQLLVHRLSSSEKRLYGDSLCTGDRVVIRREAFEDLPERVIISDPKNWKLIYLNQSARRDVGIAPDESLAGKLCYEALEGCSRPCRDCPNLLLRQDYFYAASHLYRRTGDTLLVRACLIPWEGHSVRLTIAFNMEEYARTMMKDHELIYQEMQANNAITVGMAEEDPDLGINKTIGCISNNLKPERFLIFEERDDNTVSAVYEWTAHGLPPLKEELQSIPRTELRALYREFSSHHVVMVSDMDAFRAKYPGFSLRIHGVRRFVSGQLMLPDRTVGFTMVINPSKDTFRMTSLLLSTLTDFIAIMIRNRNSMRRLEEQSMRDQLTGAGNRWGMERRIRAFKGEGPLGVISIDLNGLKNTNDSEGHHAGDMLICETARILQECAGAECVFRTGGDEFVVVTEGMEEDDIRLLIQHIHERARDNGISMAVGYAVSQRMVSDFDALLTKADLKMYEDKGHSYRRRSTDRE